MTVGLRALLLLGLSLGLSLAATGCVLDDECTAGATRCDSPARLESCETGSDPPESPHWEPTDCAGQGLICTEGVTGVALCAVSADPIAVCAGAATGEHCDGDRLILCAEGLAAFEMPCPATCVSDASGPFCVEAAARDPLCADAFTACDATTRIECRDGYRTRASACEGAGGCQTAPVTYQNGVFDTALCALAPTPDARCPEADNLAFAGQSSFCEGDLLFECYGGWLVQRISCAPIPDGSEAACVTPRPGDSECRTTATVLEGTERGAG